MNDIPFVVWTEGPVSFWHVLVGLNTLQELMFSIPKPTLANLGFLDVIYIYNMTKTLPKKLTLPPEKNARKTTFPFRKAPIFGG